MSKGPRPQNVLLGLAAAVAASLGMQPSQPVYRRAMRLPGVPNGGRRRTVAQARRAAIKRRNRNRHRRALRHASRR